MTGRTVRFLIALTICLAAVRSKEKTLSSKGLLASVTEYPLFLHKCTATFLSPIALVTTASCVASPRKHEMFIRVVTKKLEDPEAPVYDVRKTVYHPKYNGKPTEYDIGLIFLQTHASNVNMFELPDPNLQYTYLPSIIYSWRFSHEEKIYGLVTTRVNAISHDVCSEHLHYFVSNKYICVLGKNSLSQGPSDQGSPVIGCPPGKNCSLLGIYTRSETQEVSRVVLYQSVFQYLHWIRRVLEENSQQTTTLRPRDRFKPPPAAQPKEFNKKHRTENTQF